MSSGSRLAHRHTTGERHAGWVALALTVICWVGSSELMQWMQEGNAYDNPVAITMFVGLLHDFAKHDRLSSRSTVANHMRMTLVACMLTNAPVEVILIHYLQSCFQLTPAMP